MALETPEISISYKRGDSRAMIFVLSDPYGTPLDLTGYTSPVLAVNSQEEPVDETGQLFSVVGVINADPTTGKISFSPTTVDSDQTPGTYYYDAQVIDPAGGKLTFVGGTFTIVQDIAKA